MKRKNLFILLVTGLLTLGLNSCGSDNEKAPVPTVNAASPVGALDPNFNQTSCANATSYTDLRNKVHAGQFVTEINDIENYQLGRYEFREGEKWYHLDSYRRVDGITRASYKGQDRVVHEAGTSKAAVLDRLKSIVDNAVSYVPTYGKHEIYHADGSVYRIDLCYPLAANPVAERNTSGDIIMLEYSNRNMGSSYPTNNFYRFY